MTGFTDARFLAGPEGRWHSRSACSTTPTPANSVFLHARLVGYRLGWRYLNGCRRSNGLSIRPERIPKPRSTASEPSRKRRIPTAANIGADQGRVRLLGSPSRRTRRSRDPSAPSDLTGRTRASLNAGGGRTYQVSFEKVGDRSRDMAGLILGGEVACVGYDDAVGVRQSSFDLDADLDRQPLVLLTPYDARRSLHLL